jgi:hypothetical protein
MHIAKWKYGFEFFHTLVQKWVFADTVQLILSIIHLRRYDDHFAHLNLWTESPISCGMLVILFIAGLIVDDGIMKINQMLLCNCTNLWIAYSPLSADTQCVKGDY